MNEFLKNAWLFKRMKRWGAIIVAMLCLIAVAACTPYSEERAGVQETSAPYGNYIFETAVYMNPLSSFLAHDGYVEYYTFTEDALVITEEAGSQRSIPVIYERRAFDEQNFMASFDIDVGTPDISKYKERYKYTLNEPTSTNPTYQLYLMDSEVWLARLNKGSMWSIYKISRFEGALPKLRD